ncbi:MAG: hypothetical protein JW900_13395 [Anaerolineae bacterium]|nr:hypothetical protein [Anaerolineae bacterium]
MSLRKERANRALCPDNQPQQKKGKGQGLRRAYIRCLPCAALFAVAFVVYGYALDSPFMKDAPEMLAWLQNHTLLTLWTDASGFPFYRPLSWCVLMALSPAGPAALHLFNIGLHGLAAVLLWRIVARLMPDQRWLGPAAGLLFLLYPFSYEVVTTTEPVVQTVSLTAMLLATSCYVEWRKGLRLPGLLAACASIFAGEYGVVLPAVLLGVELWQARRRGQPFRWQRTLPYWGLAALYLVARTVVPRSALGDWSPGLELVPKLLYLLQALFYPLAPLAFPLARQLSISPEAGLLVTAGLAAGAVALLAGQARNRPSFVDALLLALGWTAINASPLFLLSADYLLNGPRLLYLPAAGIALFWALVLLALLQPLRTRRPALALVLFLLVTAAIALPAWNASRQVVETAEEVVDLFLKSQRPPRDAVVVNFVSWLAPSPPLYPIGKQGFTIVPGFSDLGTLAWANQAHRPPGIAIDSLFFGIVWQEWELEQRFYQQQVGWEELAETIQAGDPLLLYRYTPSALALEEIGAAPLDAAPPAPLAAVGETGLTLTARAVLLPPGDQLAVVIDWQASEAVPRDLTAFVHLYNGAGQVLQQRDGRPLGDLYPFWLWPAGEYVQERRIFWLDGALPAGASVGVGVYDPATGERLLLTSLSSDATITDNGLRVPILRDRQ